MICTLGSVVIVVTNRLLPRPVSHQEAARSKRVITIAAAGFDLASPVAGPNEADPPTSSLCDLFVDR